jgi:hypothetical protein
MKSARLGIQLLCLLLLFTRCHKCHDEQLATMAFSQDDLNINPYENGSNVTFIGSSNDTLKYPIERQMVNTAHFENSNTDDFALHGCKGRWYYSEYNTTSLSNPGKPWIVINLDFTVSYTGQGGKLVGFFVHFPDTTIEDFAVPLKFDNGVIMNLDSYDPSSSQYLEALLDSVKIGPNVYHNVYEIVNEPVYQGKYTNWVSRFYYSISEGVVGYIMKGNEYYYLKR